MATDGSTTTDLISEGLRLQVDKAEPARVSALFYFPESTNVCAAGKQLVRVRTPQAVSEPNILDHFTLESCEDGKLTWRLQGPVESFTGILTCEVEADGLRFRLKVTGSQPIWLAEWSLSGLQLENFIIPALGGQILSDSMPDKNEVSYKYPFWWNAQFAVGQNADGGVWLQSRDTKPNLKLFRLKRENEAFTITFGYEAQAPIRETTLEFDWFLRGFQGSWKRPVDAHRNWMQTAFQVPEFESKPNNPAWTRDINILLEMWGADKRSNTPRHTFSQMIDRLNEWKELHPPENTLVYLPGFAEHGIDSNAPSYNPSELLGGKSQFKKLVDHAHKLGFRVMVHTNVLAMAFTHPKYEKFRQYQVVDPWDRPQTWGLDMDGDWLTEPYFAYMNPGEDAWTDLMSEILGELIDSFEVDAVFLDQTLLAFNNSKGPNFVEGMRKHVQTLQSRFPNTLFAGEGLHEHMLAPLPFTQIHGIDSISGVHGQEGQVGWRLAHPVSSYLFNPSTKFMAHLLTKHPDHPDFKLQESVYEKLDVMPVVCLYENTQPLDTPNVRRVIERANRLKQSRVEEA